MIQSQDLNDNLFYRIINYSYWLLMGNVYFFIFSLPFLIVFQFQWSTGNLFYWLLLILTLLPIGPALTAAFSVMGKLVREKQISITKDFFKSFKQNFCQSLLIWALQLTFSVILIADVYFMTDNKPGSYLIPLFYILLILNLVMGFYIYPILSRFVISSKPLIKLSIGLTFFKIKITLLLLMLIGLTGLLLFYVPFMSIFFVVGPFCFIVMIFFKGLLAELENSIHTASIQKPF